MIMSVVIAVAAAIRVTLALQWQRQEQMPVTGLEVMIVALTVVVGVTLSVAVVYTLAVVVAVVGKIRLILECSFCNVLFQRVYLVKICTSVFKILKNLIFWVKYQDLHGIFK